MKHLLAYLIKAVGVFLSFCGVTGTCIIVLVGLVIKRVLSHQSNEIEYSIQWILKDHHPYFVAAYIIICLVAIILLHRNYRKQNKKLLSPRKMQPANQVLKNV